jgi:hypothetical protein
MASPTGATSISTDANTDSATTVEAIELKSIVAMMFSRELFKLDPTTAQAYFANIATLQPRPSEQSWQKTFAGPSRLPWMEEVLVELHDVGGRWILGRSQISWRPPAAQARALYDRLVAEVRAARKRKPNFGEDESADGKDQRFVGWTWCNQSCEAIVQLGSHVSSEAPPQMGDNQPGVLLQVYTPEGP